MSIGERLLELRKKKNLSQEEVASSIGVSRQTISKWETDQSVPDFDKIVPLSELFEITTDELLRGKKEECPEIIIESGENEEQIKIRKRTALVVSSSVVLYILAVVWVIMSIEFFQVDDVVSCGVFLLICAVPTAMLIYHFMTIPKEEAKGTREKKIKNKQINIIQSIIALFFVPLYLGISFATSAWHITWIIWIVYALICEIVELLFSLGDDKNE